jgi:hypothetical protein
MPDRRSLVGVLFLFACSKPYAAPVSSSTAATPDQTFECAMKQMQALGYNRSSYDTDERRVNGTKIDPKAHRADTQFRRVLNKLEMEVSSQPDGKTKLEVVGHTFAEYTTQRGPTEVEEKPSDQVRADTQQLLKRCASS